MTDEKLPKVSMGCNVAPQVCSVCKEPWQNHCIHNPRISAEEHAKLANPMTHFMYVSFDSSPLVTKPADPGPPKETEKDDEQPNDDGK